MERTLSMKTRQTLALSPRLQQSVRLLQLSALEFAQEINQALVSNPFLEEDETEETQAGTTTPALHELDEAAREEPPPPEEPSPASADDAYDGSGSHADPAFGERSAGNRNDDSESDWTDWIEAALSLRDHLRNQLLLAQLSDRDRTLAHVIIEALDDDGYLRQSLDELADACTGIEPPVEPDDLRAALRLVQCLEPAGVGARDLAECLDLQLSALPARYTRPGAGAARRARTSAVGGTARNRPAATPRGVRRGSTALRARPDPQARPSAGNTVRQRRHPLHRARRDRAQARAASGRWRSIPQCCRASA